MMYFQLSHSLTPYVLNAEHVIGLLLQAKLYSADESFTELMLKVRSASITIRAAGVEGYINLQIPTNLATSSELTDRVAGRVELKLYNTLIDGSSYAVQIYDDKLNDFRYDIGSRNSTFTLVLRGDYATPVKGAVVLSSYVSKKKRAYIGASAVFVYSVNVLDFRRFSIGADFIEVDTTGTISNIQLTLSNGNSELLIEVTE